MLEDTSYLSSQTPSINIIGKILLEFFMNTFEDTGEEWPSVSSLVLKYINSMECTYLGLKGLTVLEAKISKYIKSLFILIYSIFDTFLSLFLYFFLPNLEFSSFLSSKMRLNVDITIQHSICRFKRLLNWRFFGVVASLKLTTCAMSTMGQCFKFFTFVIYGCS